MGMVGCWAEEKFRMIKVEKDKPEGEGRRAANFF